MGTSIVVQALRTLVRWHERRRTAAALSALSDRMLRDVGIDRRDIPWLAEKATRYPADRNDSRLAPRSGVTASPGRWVPRTSR